MSFPLYDELAKEALTNPVDLNGKKLATNLASLPVEHGNIVFLLIYHHNNNKYTSIPYGGTFLPAGKGVCFAIQSIPPALQQILEKYLARIT
jgi:hypothetical protein